MKTLAHEPSNSLGGRTKVDGLRGIRNLGHFDEAARLLASLSPVHGADLIQSIRQVVSICWIPLDSFGASCYL